MNAGQDSSESAASLTGTTNTSTVQSEKHLPGEAGIWFFIFADMMVFGVFFVTFVVYRADDVAEYRQSAQLLNPWFGVANTLLLLTSSWFVASAVRALRLGKRGSARTLITLAALCGAAFEVDKFFEYGQKIRHGITPLSNDFFMFYYMLTGIHFLHVLIGIGVLLLLRKEVQTVPISAAGLIPIENGASFWHLVDILWIVLFAIFYLLR